MLNSEARAVPQVLLLMWLTFLVNLHVYFSSIYLLLYEKAPKLSGFSSSIFSQFWLLALLLVWAGPAGFASPGEAWLLGLRPQPGELDPTPLPASGRLAQACSPGHWTPQTAGSDAHAFKTLLCPIGQCKSRGQTQLERGKKWPHFKRTGVGKSQCKQVCIQDRSMLWLLFAIYHTFSW